MIKMSNAQAGQIVKLAAENLRALSEENQELKSKLAAFEKKAHAEKIASAMEEKGLEPELSYTEKVAGLLQREDLTVVEEAVGMSAPQMKLASVREDTRVTVESEFGNDQAADVFASNLASI